MKKKNCKNNKESLTSIKKAKRHQTQSCFYDENLDFIKTNKSPKHFKRSSQLSQMINSLNNEVIRQNRAMQNVLKNIKTNNKISRSTHKIKESKSGVKVKQLVSEQKNILKSLSKTKNRFLLTLQY